MSTGARDLREAAGGALASRLSPRYLEEHCLIPLGIAEDGILEIAVGAGLGRSVADELSRLYKAKLRAVEVPRGEVIAAIMSATRQDPPRPARAAENGGHEESGAIDDLEALANQAPVIKLVNVLLLDAFKTGASDIHIESNEAGLRVRYRLDGVLQEVSQLADQYGAAVISRIKIMARLDIAERRRSQDGRARTRLADRDVDLRVSILPALHGESVVLRILDHAGHGRDLANLGMPPGIREDFERLIHRTSGMILVTGPTGSGKTTTLYAALARVNAPGVKIVTVEDPVEYQIPGVIQIPVNPKAGFGFDTALSSILRHDPDVIMVGEMRDRTTAELAIQAALTGHLVFSTLHTTDAASAITRLVEMKIEPYLVAATVQGIVAQRLVRLLCDDCAETYEPEPAELPARNAGNGAARYRKAKGCEKCAQTGYRGRVGIYEYLPVSDSHRAVITRGGTLAELRSVNRDGFHSLMDAGWDLVRAGRTSIAELRRVVNESADA
ncbi:MAG TPA: GspE/PulE family protein [Gemmatimonadaceae bacterium]|nr:GspE/PulE family protein [Gemmatimonadaceae bacterium]